MSPIVEIVVGDTVLRAHQNLILESPFLEEFVKRFDESGPVSTCILRETFPVH